MLGSAAPKSAGLTTTLNVWALGGMEVLRIGAISLYFPPMLHKFHPTQPTDLGNFSARLKGSLKTKGNYSAFYSLKYFMK